MGISLKEPLGNACVTRTALVENIMDWMRKIRLRWFGYVVRGEDENLMGSVKERRKP